MAPAKINWTLEVLGKREDGYHEIRSVMQTIDLCDEVVVNRATDLQERRQRELRQAAEARQRQPTGPLLGMRSMPVAFNWGGEIDAWRPDDGPNPWTQVAIKVVELLDPDWERDARIDLRKRVPVAAGLGGGSSNAAALLRALDLVWEMGVGRDRLAEFAAGLGSDVAFFLHGGTALAEGRGEHVTPLPNAPTAWLVLVVPPMKIAEKTKRMYGAITEEDFSDGSLTAALSQRLGKRKAVHAEDVSNAFERVAYKVFDGLEGYRDALKSTGAQRVHLAGAGPTLFALAGDEVGAREMAERLRPTDAKVFTTRTLTAAEATAVTD